MKKNLILAFLLLAMGTLHAQVPAYIPTNGLLGWYPFNGNANNEFVTTPPELPNATVNGATITTDRFGTANCAYSLNGDTDNILIDSAFFWVAWGNYTISCWVNSDTLDNPNNGNHAQAIFNTIPHNGLALYFNWGYDNKYEMFAGSNPPTSGWDILSHKKSNTPPVAHAWKHVVMVKKLDSFYSLYINGVLDTTYKSYTMGMPYYCKLIMGRSDPGVISEGFFGKIDDYGIWHRALTECEITKLYKSSPYLYITSQPTGTSASPAHLHITDTGIGNTYQWQALTVAGFVNATNGTQYSGVTTPTLTVVYPSYLLSDVSHYRCIVMGATCTDTSSTGFLAWEGIEKHTIGNSTVTIFPNPTTGDFYITGADKAHVRIFDNTGRVVTKEVNTGKISIGTLAAGLYIIELSDDDGKLLLRDKLLKQ